MSVALYEITMPIAVLQLLGDHILWSMRGRLYSWAYEMRSIAGIDNYTIAHV